MFKYVINTEHPERGVERFEYTRAEGCDMQGVILQFQKENPEVKDYFISCDVYNEAGECYGGIARADSDSHPVAAPHGFENLIYLDESDQSICIDTQEHPTREVVLAMALVAACASLGVQKGAQDQGDILSLVDHYLEFANNVDLHGEDQIHIHNDEEDFGGPVS